MHMHFLMYDVVGKTDKALFHHVMYMNVNFLALEARDKDKINVRQYKTSQRRLGLV